MAKKLYFICMIFISCIHIGSAQSALDDIIKSYDSFNKDVSEKYKHSWPIKTEKDIEEKILFLKSIKNDLSKIEPDPNDTNSQINIEMLDFILGHDIYNLKFGIHKMPLNSEGGFLTSMLGSVRGKNLKNEKDIKNYIDKIGTTVLYLDNQTEWLNKGIKDGKMRPKLVVNNCIELLEDILKEEKLFLFKPLEGKHDLDYHYENEIYKAFKRFHSYLKNTYLPKAPKNIGIRKINNGKSFYEQRIKYYTTLDMTPQEVFDLGHKEVKRIRKEMEEIIKELKFEGDFKAFTDFLRTDEQFYAKTDKEILYYASWLSKKA